MSIDVDLALGQPRAGRFDCSERATADFHFAAGVPLPFADESVRSLGVGDAVADWSVRDRLQLMLDCRRVLAGGAHLILVEPKAQQTLEALARWAAFVGLVEIAAATQGPGWKRSHVPSDPAPLVTIAIPSSNPRYFLECLDSAIAQTYPRLEILICDDSGGDEIAAMAASRAARAEIRFERNRVRLRTRRNYERLLELARGEYVKFLNDDDALEPTCVARLVDAFARAPGLTLATSHRWRMDAQSRIIDDMPATRPAVARDLIVDGISLANAVIMHGLNFIGEPSTGLFRKRDFDRRPHIDGERPFHFNGEEVRGAADLAMWSRLLMQGNAAFLAQRLSRFRVHDQQAQARPDVMARSIDGIRRLQRQWIELGLFRRFPPHLLATRPLRDSPSSGPWQLDRILCLPGPDDTPEAALAAWRATQRHPFDPLPAQ